MRFYTILYQIHKPKVTLKVKTFNALSFTSNTHPSLTYYRRRHIPIKTITTTHVSNDITRYIPQQNKKQIYKECVNLLNYVYIQYFTMRREQLPQEEKDRILKALAKRIFYGTEIEKDFFGAIFAQIPHALYPEIHNLAIYCMSC